MTAQHAVTVIGAGDMGHGFATLFTVKGQNVTLVDHRESNLDEAAERIRGVVSFLRAEGETDRDPDAVVDAIEFTTDQATGVSEADLVLESVPEDLEVKQKTYREVAEHAPDTAVMASNTSGIPVTDIAEAVPEHAGRVVGCHWWYPPYLLPSVEVVRGEETTDETVDRVTAFLDAVDRKPVMVERDVPGFVWNRIQMAIFRESLHLVEAGVTSFEDIDRAIRDGYALRTAAIGPFETMDIAGLDLVETVLDNLSPHLCDDDDASQLFEEHLENGRSGIHDGAGFYEYDRSPDAITRDRDETVMAIRHAREELEEE
jgi:3-hydroxybutyryl-CoA dehydrogenase